MMKVGSSESGGGGGSACCKRAYRCIGHGVKLADLGRARCCCREHVHACSGTWQV